MSVIGSMARQDKGTAPVLPQLQAPPSTTGFFQNVSAGYTQAVAGPHSTQNAKAIYESRYYDQIRQALAAEGEHATDYVESPVLRSSPLYHPVPGERVQGDKVFVPVARPFSNPFSEGPSVTRDVNPLANFYLGGDAQEISNMWAAVQRVRQRKPGFLKELKDEAALNALAQSQRQADQARAQDVTSRATGLGAVGQFIGGAAGSIVSGDPENLVGGFAAPVERAAGKSIARQILRSSVSGAGINAAAGVAAVPGQMADAQSMGQEFTGTDAAKAVGEAALVGAAFGTAHVVVPKAVSAAGRAAGTVAGKVAENLPAAVRDPVVAASIRAGTVKDRSLLYEFQRTHSPYSIADTSTPTEKAAAHVMVRGVETQEQSPLKPEHAPVNEQNLSAIASALGVDLAPPDVPTTAPTARATVRDHSEGATAPRRSASYQEAVGAAEGKGKNPDSSADGYFQFTKGTWLEYAPKVTDTAGMSEKQIFALRHDKGIASAAEERFRADNADYLRKRGLEDSPGNLSLAHFLGKKDAARVLNADPSTPIERVVSPDSIAHNKNVFKNIATADDMVAWAHKRIGSTVDHAPARPDAVPDEGFDYGSPVPYTVETLRPEELPPTSAAAPTDEPFNHTLSQHLLVWERENGTRELIDGGKRLAHARSQEDQGITLPTVVLKESDGISEEMALLVGKLKNVNLGTTPLEEAAGALADIPEIAAQLQSPQFRRGIAAIAQLPYEDFGAVVRGELDPRAAAQISEPVPDERTAKLAEQIRSYWANQKEGGFRRKPVQVVTTADGKIKTWAATASKGYVSDRFNPDEGDVVTQLRPDAHAELDALIASRYKDHAHDAGREADSSSARQPLGAAGRDFAPEAPDANLPHGSEPSLFDTAIAARDTAEQFSDPHGAEAAQQTALLEHDLRGQLVTGEVIKSLGIPSLDDGSRSWIVLDAETGEHVFRTANELTATKAKDDGYEVITSAQWAKRSVALPETGPPTLGTTDGDVYTAADIPSLNDGLRAAIARADKKPATQETTLDAIERGLMRDGDMIELGNPRWALERGFADIGPVNGVRKGRLTDAGRARLEELRAASDAGSEPPKLDLDSQTDPAIAERQAQEVALKTASPMQSTAEQQGTMGLPMFDVADAPNLFDLPSTGFRLSEEGEKPISLKEALDAADAEEAAAQALRDCL